MYKYKSLKNIEQFFIEKNFVSWNVF